jgi:hypothetical protein
MPWGVREMNVQDPDRPSQFGILDIESENLKRKGAALGSRLFFWMNSRISGWGRIGENASLAAL